MKILESQMALPDRMIAEAGVEELTAEKKHGILSTTVANIEELSTIKEWFPSNIPDQWKEYQSVDTPEDFDPLSYVPKEMFNNGSLDHAWSEVISSRNQAEVMEVISNANAGARRKEIMANGSGWGNFWGTTVGIISSPEYWPSLMWNPSGGVVRTGIELGLIGAAETAMHEYTLQTSQANRDPYESWANVGAASLISGVLGGAIGKFVKPVKTQTKNPFLGASREISHEVDDIAHNQSFRNVEDLPDEIPVVNPMARSVGAAESGLGEGAKPLRGLRWKSGYISLMRPLVKARISAVQEVMELRFGSDFQIRANAKEVEVWDAQAGKMVKTGQIEHQAKAPSLARQVDRESNAMLTGANRAIINGFRKYVKHQGKSFTVARMKNRGKWEEFNKKVRWATSNNDMAEDAADVAVTEAAQGIRSSVYAPIEKLAREMEVLDKAAKDQLKKTLQKITQRMSKSEDVTEMEALARDLEKAQKELDDFDEIIGDVKFADTYANRRLHRENIEDKATRFKEMLFDRYKEIRQADALEDYKNTRLDKIVKKKEQIIKKEIELQRGIDKAQKEVDAKTVMPKSKGVAKSELDKIAMKQWQKELKSAHTKLKNAIAKMKTNNLLVRWRSEIAKAEDEIDSARLEHFTIKDNEGLAAVTANVNSSYQKALNGELIGEIWQKGAHRPKAFKERQLPLTDNELLAEGFLHTDMLDQVKGYINSTLRPLRMKQAAGDTEMVADLRYVEGKYDIAIAKAEKAGKEKLARSLDQEKTLNIEALELARDRYYDRTTMYRGRAATIANIGRSIRNLNVMRMMGGVLTTSLNDINRLNAARIFSKEMGGKGPGLMAAFKTLKSGTTEEAMVIAGFAAETVHMARMTKLVDMGVPLMTGNKFSKQLLNTTSVGAKALMKATLLTQWTDFMKMMAAAMTQNQTVYLMRNYAKLGKSEKTILAEMGIDEAFAKQVMGQFDAHGEMYGKYASSLNWDEWTDQVAAERMKDIMFRQSERILVTPRETDLPMVLADNELGRAFLQFKSFSLAAHNQTTVPMLERAQGGDLMSVYAMATMSIGAVPVEMIKMWEAGREDELAKYSAMDWGFAIADRSAVAPMLSMGFNMIDMTAGNRITQEFGAKPISRYSDRTMLGALGPSFSTVGDMIRLTSGLAKDGVDNRDARAVRRLAPFQNHTVLNRLANKYLPNQKRNSSDNRYSEK